jgi:hypothetical protein
MPILALRGSRVQYSVFSRVIGVIATVGFWENTVPGGRDEQGAG